MFLYPKKQTIIIIPQKSKYLGRTNIPQICFLQPVFPSFDQIPNYNKAAPIANPPKTPAPIPTTFCAPDLAVAVEVDEPDVAEAVLAAIVPFPPLPPVAVGTEVEHETELGRFVTPEMAQKFCANETAFC